MQQYEILRHVRFEESDDKNSNDIRRKKGNPHKHITIAIETCLGAMYTNKMVSWDGIIKKVKEWKRIIDVLR